MKNIKIPINTNFAVINEKPLCKIIPNITNDVPAGTSFVILGMILQSGFSLITAKLVFIGIFIFFTSPITGHVTANLARKKGVNPVGKTKGKTL